ncbi:MAG: polyhydroxyalkanoic acid system family protein [Sphingomonadaceae bacterium]
MRVPIPHSLGREEARRRLHSRSGEIAGLFPGGMADVTVDWPSEDRMELLVKAMGKAVNGSVEIADDLVTFVIDLPPALSFFESMIRGTVEQKGTKLLG